MGVRGILREWVAWRVESTRRRMNFDLAKKTDRLHLLHGLEAILLDIDKAIAIIRGTKLEADVVPNLMKGFGIDRVRPSCGGNQTAQHQRGIHHEPHAGH